MLTLEELSDRILNILILELRQITSTELRERFEDIIELHWDKLVEAIDDERT